MVPLWATSIPSQHLCLFPHSPHSYNQLRAMAATKSDYGANWWALLAIPAAAAATQTPTATISWPVFAFLAVMLLAFALISWAAPGGPAWGRLKKRNTIPGPRGWPLVGSLMVMGERAHTRLASLAASHGAKRLMSFSLGDTLAIIASHPDVAKEILNSSAFADRPIKESAYQLMFDRAIGFAPYTEYWRNLRRIAATHLFSPRRISAFEKYRQSAVSSVLSAVDNNMQAGGVVVVREIFQTASLNNVMRSVFGRSYDFGSGNAEAKELQGMVREGYELLGVFNWGDHLTLMNFLDLQGIRKRCKSLVPRVNAFVKKIIDDHRANPCVNSTESDFVDVLLSMQGNDRLTESDMIAVLWEMIFRGTDTVAILLEWILARLVMHADIQEKIHRELDEVVGNSRKLTETDIPKLGYLQAVVKETLRVHPPGPLLSWARLAIHDVKVDGHMVPAGTTAMVNMWSITHDSSVWECPLEFKPERFVSESGGEDVNVMGSDLRLAPFGSGRRVCPGKALGLATVHLWLARLLHHYEFLPSDSEHAIDLSEVLKLSCELKTPLAVKAVRRNELEFL